MSVVEIACGKKHMTVMGCEDATYALQKRVMQQES
jgi:hypothetical protein